MNKDIFGKEKQVPNHFIHTPKEVIGLISHLLKIPEGTILDPSCGDGSILYELARTLTENQKLNIKLLGYENSSANCETARFKLSSHNIDAEIINTDFLASDSSTKFNMILTNPPFNYHRSGGRTESLFIGRIMDSLNDYGVASIIMPYGFLDRQIDSKYRKRLYQEFDIQLITLLPIGIFPEKVHTCIICFRKCPPTNEVLKLISPPQYLIKNLNENLKTIYKSIIKIKTESPTLNSLTGAIDTYIQELWNNTNSFYEDIKVFRNAFEKVVQSYTLNSASN